MKFLNTVIIMTALSAAGCDEYQTAIASESQAQTSATKCLRGDMYVQTQADYELLQKQSCVSGDVLFDGVLTFGVKALETIDLGNLSRVGGSLVINGCPRLKFITAPYLTHVGGLFRITDNPMLLKCKAKVIAEQLGLMDEHGECDLFQCVILENSTGSCN